MRLVDEATQNEIKVGDIVKTFRGKSVTVEGMREPHKPSSTGRVTVRTLDGKQVREYFPGVIGAVWVD